MSLENQYSITHFEGNGSTTAFPFEFKVWDTGHVKVYVNETGEQEDVTESVTITLNDGGDAGGLVTFVEAPAAGVRIAVARKMPFVQEDRYVSGTRIDPHELEDRFDQDCAERQELREAISRAFVTPETSEKTGEEYMEEVQEQLSEAVETAQSAAGVADAAQDAVNALDANVVKLTGNQTIGGTKTFSSTIVGDITGNAATATTATASKGFVGYSSSETYAAGAAVTGSDGNLYVANRSVTAVNPVGDATGAWQKIPNASINGGHNPVDIFSGPLTSTLVIRSDQRGSGDYSRAVVQSVAYDPIGDLLYMLHETDEISGGSARYAAISRHEITDKSDIVTTKDMSSRTLANIGHQGLAVEITDALDTATEGLVTNAGAIKLWCSNKYGSYGGTALRFSYKANDNEQNIQEYTLVNYSGNLSLSPCISYDQRFLIVTYRTTVDGDTVYRLRVFDLKTLVDGGPGDYTTRYVADFPIDQRFSSMSGGGRGFQAMASDGYYVYVLLSKTNTSSPAALWCYTLDGKLVAANLYVTLGFKESYDRNQALEDRNQDAFCEPEGLFFMPVNGILRLCVAVNVQSPWATKSAKALYVYALGANDEGCVQHTQSVIVANDTTGGAGFVKRETAFERGTIPNNGKIGSFWHYDQNGNALGSIYHQVSAANYSYWTYRTYKNEVTSSYFDLQFIWYSGDTAFFLPRIGTVNLGSASYPWNNTYCASGAWTGSDERIKDSIAPFPDAVLDAWGDVNWQQFQMRDAIEQKGKEEARLHGGIVAQRVAEAFAAHGLDATRYGLFCHDVWEAQPEVLDENGNVITPAQEAGDLYGIRYGEALAMEAAYQRRRASRAEARIAALEQRLDEMEAALAALGGMTE